MAEQKAKPAAKKASPGKASSAATVKPKATKVTATVAAKKSVAAAAKKAAASVANKKIPAKKTAAAGTRPAAKKITTKPTPEERYLMVQTAAYFIAERNGFGGCATEHWASAEIEIANRLGQ